MNNGWELSAQAWIDSMGECGDWGREHVLDPVMLGRVAVGRFERFPATPLTRDAFGERRGSS